MGPLVQFLAKFFLGLSFLLMLTAMVFGLANRLYQSSEWSFYYVFALFFVGIGIALLLSSIKQTQKSSEDQESATQYAEEESTSLSVDPLGITYGIGLLAGGVGFWFFKEVSVIVKSIIVAFVFTFITLVIVRAVLDSPPPED